MPGELVHVFRASDQVDFTAFMRGKEPIDTKPSIVIEGYLWDRALAHRLGRLFLLISSKPRTSEAESVRSLYEGRNLRDRLIRIRFLNIICGTR
jgi:hypothetical protein